MKVNVLFEENEMCLRAQSQRDLEFLHKMQGIHTPGPWAHAEFSNLTFGELGFDPKDAGKQYALHGQEPCVMAWVRLKLDWLTYAQPAPADNQLRAEAAKRIGYSILDGLQLVAKSYKEPKTPPLAEVFIELLPDGFMHLRSERNGRFDSTYAKKPQEHVMTIELPKLIAELRDSVRPLPEHMTT